MEEKERYEYIHNDEIGDGILDIKTNNEVYDTEQMSDLLNQQDKRIKELEYLLIADKKMKTNSIKGFEKLKQENQQLKEENGYIIFTDGYDENGNEIYRQKFVKYKDKFSELVEENKQLKQSQKNLAISELEEVNGLLTDTIIEVTENEFNVDKLCYLEEISSKFREKINDKIKELKGEKNEL